MEQSLYSIASDYSFLDSTMAVAMVPIKDFNISEKCVIDDNINIYPKHTLDTSVIQGSIYDFSFQEIKDIFYDATIIAFPIILFLSFITASNALKIITNVVCTLKDDGINFISNPNT